MYEVLAKQETQPSIEIGKGFIEIKDNGTKARIAKTSFRRIGGPQHPDKKIIVDKFDVEPAYQNKGYGKTLMDELKNILTTEGRTGLLSVHADNTNAQDFYESQGWEFEDEEDIALPSAGQKANEMQLYMVYEPLL